MSTNVIVATQALLRIILVVALVSVGAYAIVLGMDVPQMSYQECVTKWGPTRETYFWTAGLAFAAALGVLSLVTISFSGPRRVRPGE